MLNKTLLIGNLGQDPDIRTSQYGSVANLSIATTKNWKDKKTGEWNSHTEWHRVVAFGYTADTADKYLRKGDQVFVEGSLQTRKWQDKEGNDRYTTEVKAMILKKLGRKDQNEERSERSGGRGDNENEYGHYGPPDNGTGDDVPF